MHSFSSFPRQKQFFLMDIDFCRYVEHEMLYTTKKRPIVTMKRYSTLFLLLLTARKRKNKEK